MTALRNPEMVAGARNDPNLLIPPFRFELVRGTAEFRLNRNILGQNCALAGYQCICTSDRMFRVKPVVKFVLVTCVSGLIGC